MSRLAKRELRNKVGFLHDFLSERLKSDPSVQDLLDQLGDAEECLNQDRLDEAEKIIDEVQLKTW